jgi:hypothetical protein
MGWNDREVNLWSLRDKWQTREEKQSRVEEYMK